SGEPRRGAHSCGRIGAAARRGRRCVKPSAKSVRRCAMPAARPARPGAGRSGPDSSETLRAIGGAPATAWYTNGMKTTIDKAGRVVIPASIRERAAFLPGAELTVTLDEFGVHL